MAQLTAGSRTKMGPGFWPVTIVMSVIVVGMGIGIGLTPLQFFIPEMGKPADEIDLLFKFLAIVGNGITVLVIGYLIYFSIVWRRRKDEPATAIGIQVHDNHKLELWWTVIPAIFVVALAVWSVKVWAELQYQPSGGLAIEAIGHQFNFEIRYPNLKDSMSTLVDPGYPARPDPLDKVDSHTMHLPVDTPVTIYVTSADVIHSFWIPEIRLKADMVPGNVQPIRFTANKVGTYRIVCAQFCGTLHGQMYGYVTVDSQANYAKWISGMQGLQTANDAPPSNSKIAFTSGNSDHGKALFGQHCTSCHNAAGEFEQKVVGPGLLHLTDNPKHPKLVTGDVPNAANIAMLLKKGYSGQDLSSAPPQPPIGAMPNADANGISTKDIADLTAYLVSLK